MFTGIIEAEGKIIQASHENNVLTLTIVSAISKELKIDQSVSHNGVCLTVVEVKDNTYQVCAVQETLNKTTIGQWQPNQIINLERCMKLSDRLDGHIVQGHVDAKAFCVKAINSQNNWIFRFQIPPEFSHLIIEKGSVCINGISLTCFNVSAYEFEVAIIPYTYEHTSIRFVQENDAVNIEFDVIGKYIARLNIKV